MASDNESDVELVEDEKENNLQTRLSSTVTSDREFLLNEQETIGNVENENLFLPHLFKNFPIIVKQTEREGRFLVAKNDIQEGELVWFGMPYVWVVYEAWTNETCRYCMSPIDEESLTNIEEENSDTVESCLCKRCLRVRYCSEVCMKRDLIVHLSGECQCLRFMTIANNSTNGNNYAPPYTPEVITEIKMLIRLLARKSAELLAKERDFQSQKIISHWEKDATYDDFECLISGTSDYETTTIASFRYWVVDYLQQLRSWLISNNLSQGTSWPGAIEENTEIVLHNLCRLKRNSFCYGHGQEEEAQAW